MVALEYILANDVCQAGIACEWGEELELKMEERVWYGAVVVETMEIE